MDLLVVRAERLLSAREESALLALLPPARQERLLRTRPPEKRREPLCAYALLWMALRERYGWRQLPEIALTGQGKPWFPEHPEVHFNLSHTVGASLVGISDSPLGVDIEKLRPVSQRSMERIAGVDSTEEFFRSWVRREARVKRGGGGIATMMREDAPFLSGERFWFLETFPGYVAGVCTRGEDVPGAVRKYSLEEMI
jgi:4'-phosphopantetheinyl transferase